MSRCSVDFTENCLVLNFASSTYMRTIPSILKIFSNFCWTFTDNFPCCKDYLYGDTNYDSEIKINIIFKMLAIYFCTYVRIITRSGSICYVSIYHILCSRFTNDEEGNKFWVLIELIFGPFLTKNITPQQSKNTESKNEQLWMEMMIIFQVIILPILVANTMKKNTKAIME